MTKSATTRIVVIAQQTVLRGAFASAVAIVAVFQVAAIKRDSRARALPVSHGTTIMLLLSWFVRTVGRRARGNRSTRQYKYLSRDHDRSAEFRRFL